LVSTPGMQVHDELHLLLATAFQQLKQPSQRLAVLADQAGIEPVIRARICNPDLARFARTRLCLELLQSSQILQLIALMREEVEIKADTLAEFHALTWEMLQHMAAKDV